MNKRIKTMLLKLALPIVTLVLSSCSCSTTYVSLTLSESNVTLGIDSSITLIPTVTPKSVDQSVTWSSSSPLIASVSSSGVVKGLKEGETTITATSVADTSKTAFCIVKVKPVNASKITLQDSLYLFKGTTGKIEADIYPEKAVDKNFTWTSSDASIATVDSGGNVTGINEGTVSVYATSIHGVISSICSVVVSNTKTSPTGISLRLKNTYIYPGNSKKEEVFYEPFNANSDKNIIWSSDNTNVATVDRNGNISVNNNAKVGQTCSITATLSSNPSIKQNCTVKVVNSTYTILIYFCGSDLESLGGLASLDIDEILSVPNQPEHINIAFQTGGSSSWQEHGIPSDKLSRYHVRNQELIFDQTLPSASMGESDTLESFLTWGLTTFPAEKTALILWNHGGGMFGVCYDELYGGGQYFSYDTLFNSEVGEALDNTFSSLGFTDCLEWIGYDACLMQVQDIAEMNSQYFTYMVGSQESETGYGWDYDSWIDNLYNSDSTTTILTEICNSYIKESEASGKSDQTLSFLDLRKMDAYTLLFEDVADYLNTNFLPSFEYRQALRKLIVNSKHFAGNDFGNFGLFDVNSILTNLIINQTFYEEDFLDKLRDTQSYLSNVVVYKCTGSYAKDASGLSLFFAFNRLLFNFLPIVYSSEETSFAMWINTNILCGTI